MDIQKINEFLTEYKKLIQNDSYNELYKWKAIKTFQKNWNIDATDFSEMLAKSFSDHTNLLVSANYYPLGMLTEFCQEDENKVKEMFSILYDENKELSSRIDFFVKSSEELLQKFNDPKKASHFQDSRSIGVYLALRFPEKYFFFIYTPYLSFGKSFGYNNIIGKSKFDAYFQGVKMAMELKEVVKEDKELLEMHRKRIPRDLYFDDNYNVLVQDIIWMYYSLNKNKIDKYLTEFAEIADDYFEETEGIINNYYSFFKEFYKEENLEKAEWPDFQKMGNNIHSFNALAIAKKNALGNPNHSIEHYRNIFKYIAHGSDPINIKLNNILYKKGEYELKFFGESALSELFGHAYADKYLYYNRRDEESAKFLGIKLKYEKGNKFGDKFLKFNEYIIPIIEKYPKIVGKRTELPLPMEVDQFFSWLYEYHIPKKEKEIEEEVKTSRPHVWLYAPGRNAKFWDMYYQEGIIGIGPNEIPDFHKYKSQKEFEKAIQKYDNTEKRRYNDARACYEFAFEIQKGDIIIAKRGRKKYIGYGIVTGDYKYDPSRKDYHHLREVEWKKQGEWGEDFKIVLKTLTNISKYPDYVANLKLKIGIEDISVSTTLDNRNESLTELISDSYVKYTIEDANRELFIEKEDIESIIQLLNYKKNIVLQGPPGTGKTYIAKKLAYLLLGVKDESKIQQIQFHQSYSYEDFIQGYRPNESGGFTLKDGVFFDFCENAKNDSHNDYFFIIDEINRGNLSKIFGELMMLIEHDKRGKEFAIPLTYSDKTSKKFYIPDNLYMIGTMNTADRSLAIVDYALRRRFVFIDILPSFNKKFISYLKSIGVDTSLQNRIVDRIVELNKVISADINLGGWFTIGHSYFCNKNFEKPDIEWYKQIVTNEIGPLLKEYWFDNTSMIDEQIRRLLD